MKIRSTSNKTIVKYAAIGALSVVILLFAGYLALSHSSRADAVKATDFNPGNIISDYVFYNKDAMNAQQIQDFLNRLIPTCLTWNNTTFVDAGGNRVGPPYVCLNNYHENPNTGETSFEKGGGAFPGGISAAQIIYDAAQQYGINPQVLLVMLKKESLGPLTSDNWPTKWQYRYAMGYACPDSGPNNSANCNDKQAGFYKQVNLAAWQFKYYKDHPNDYRYALGWNDIQYSPTVACGTKRVYIENIATLSLYIYTPYTPNDGALANYPGTAHCGAYGNRNVFMFFSEWFGSTQGDNWSSLQDPRIMTTRKPTTKINPFTNQATQQLEAGQDISFETKTGDCLRTRHDTQRNISSCVKISDLTELDLKMSYINDSTKESSFYSIKTPTCKVDIRRDVVAGDCLPQGTVIEFMAKSNVQGVDYLITKSDFTNGQSTAYRVDRLDGPIKWEPLINPRTMITMKPTEKINPFTAQATQTLDYGLAIKFATKAGDCLRTQHDTENNINSCIKISNLAEYSSTQNSLSSKPTYYEVVRYTCKVDYVTNKLSSQCFNAGDKISVLDLISVDGSKYYTTRNDSSKGIILGFIEERLKAL